jgi:hypothetical protein
MITAEIPKDTTFELPEGKYKARLKHVKEHIKQNRQGTKRMIRFLFEVFVPGMDHLNCMAGRNFDLNLNPGTDLRNWLEGFLGRRFFMDRSGKTINFEEFIGSECELTLEHFWGKDYETPHVTVARIAPPGTLKLTVEGKD